MNAVFQLAENVHCHHVIPKNMGGTDTFNNLMIIHP
ncbi:HNH endonuclease [Enterococcus faecalis]|nr:HNH endonuclease [Enterococcus faecalis]